MLTDHQLLHVRAIIKDADDIADRIESARVKDWAQRLVEGTDKWPNPYLKPYEIHLWIEEPDLRVALEREIVKYRLGVSRG